MAEIHEQYLPFESKVAEMGTLDSMTIDVPIDPALLTKIKAKDANPQFVTLEIISGVSTSKRRWKPEHLERVARIVNERRPVGYKGHIPEKDSPTAFPPIHTMWLGAVTKRVGEKCYLYLKGYNKPTEIRDEIDLGMVDAVSIYGDSTLRRGADGVLDVVDFQLESIDWARKGRNGMPSRVVSITAEMKDDETRGGKKKVETAEIAALTEQELRSNNPTLVELITRKTADEFQTKLGEQTAAVEAAKADTLTLKNLREKLGLKDDADIVAAVTELVEDLKTTTKATISELKEKAIVKIAGDNERAQKLVRRLVGEQIETDFTTVGEKTGEEIEAKVKSIVEDDEDIKAVIGEMSDRSPARSREGGAHLGGGSARPNETTPGRKSETGKVTFGTRKMSAAG